MNQTVFDDKKIALVVNGKSKRGRLLFKQSKKLLIDSGIKIDKNYCIRKPSIIQSTVERLINEGINLIIIGGGDGTISAAVDCGAYKDIVFGFLPLGTSNSFVRGLNIPLNLAMAVDIIKQGKIKPIDMGQIGGDYFANTANLGISAVVNSSVNNENKKFFGRLAYLPIALWQLLWFKPFTAYIDYQQRTYTFRCIEILIANGQYQGGLPLALDADLESGQLAIKVFKYQDWRDKFKLMFFWISTLFGFNYHGTNVELLFLDEFEISTNKPVNVDIDGESVARTPINVKVAKGALNIIVP